MRLTRGATPARPEAPIGSFRMGILGHCDFSRRAPRFPETIGLET